MVQGAPCGEQSSSKLEVQGQLIELMSTYYCRRACPSTAAVCLASPSLSGTLLHLQ